MSTSDDALREAAQRLLGGTPLHTDGALTVYNLAREAGVGRATVYRSAVLDEFRQAVANREHREPVITALRDEVRQLKAERGKTRRRHADQVSALQADVSQLLQVVQVLTLERDNLLRHQGGPSPIADLNSRRTPRPRRRRTR